MEAREDLKYYAKIAQKGLGYVAGQLELTSKCEQFCPNCDSWKSHQNGSQRGDLTLAEIEEIFRQLNGMKTFEHLALTGGDPLSFPELTAVLRLPRRFRLQVNTALPKEPEAEVLELLRGRVDSLRLSLDGILPRTYYKMRGVNTDPEEILERMERIDHPYWAVNTCVTDENMEEVLSILDRLQRMKARPRKAMFLAVLARETNPGFWDRYRRMASEVRKRSWAFETSVAEDVASVREFLRRPEAADVLCYSGAMSFHIKSTGDVYPCCLVGGEAIPTIKSMAVGSIKMDGLSTILSRYMENVPAHYSGSGPCRQVCQWKQLTINRLAHEASKVHMRMP